MATLADRLIDEMDELASAALRRLEGPIEAERNYVRKQQQQQLQQQELEAIVDQLLTQLEKQQQLQLLIVAGGIEVALLGKESYCTCCCSCCCWCCCSFSNRSTTSSRKRSNRSSSRSSSRFRSVRSCLDSRYLRSHGRRQ